LSRRAAMAERDQEMGASGPEAGSGGEPHHEERHDGGPRDGQGPRGGDGYRDRGGRGGEGHRERERKN
jgi:hypothetical protein